MKDLKYILIFVAIGLAIAFVTTGPLRKPDPITAQNQVGTPLEHPAAPSSGQVYAQGHINIEGVDATEATQRALFVIVRVPDQPGPPIAAKKFQPAPFPMEFSVGVQDNMVGTEFFFGDVLIVARLDKDGAAGPKQPDDWEGSVRLPASGPSRHVDLVIRP